MSFAERFKEVVTTVEATANSEPSRRYRAVLDQLVRGLRDLGIGARIETSADPRQLTLKVHPLHRPKQGSTLLRFFLDGTEIIIFGEEQKRLQTPEQLETWLLEFGKLPAFIESIQFLRDAINDPVEARLRVNAHMTYAKGDIVVTVSPDDQRRIGEAQEGQELTIEVERLQFPGNGTFDENVHHELLDSAGIVLHDIHEAQLSNGKIQITGKRKG